jgi:hypothetical protein
MTFRQRITGKNLSVVAIALLGTLGLGAKGCDRAVVGDDGECTDCEPGEGGGSSGGSSNAGSGGATAGKGSGVSGSAGSPVAGRGGSGNVGGESSGGAGTGSGPATCGTLLGEFCPADQWCEFPPEAICGAADAPGVCKPIVEACATVDDPVCGCNGITYSNACLAATFFVSVAHAGACETDVVYCGGLGGQLCADDEYCHMTPEVGCGILDGNGVCRPKPEACDTVYDPVCGCDGNTYGNECEAGMAGVSTAALGECEPDGGTCGGLRGQMCAAGTFCNYPLDAICGAADQTGTCEPIPEDCTQEYDPVCGCDDNTYSNACSANAAGVSVAAQGACETEPGVCGGIAGFECPSDQVCMYPIEAQCGDGDMTGTCVELRDDVVCTAQFDPVCGCDGRTYGNACEAMSVGMSIRSEGECPVAE